MNILIFGAGRSSVYLINELQKYCEQKDCRLTIFDQNFKALPAVLKNNSSTDYIESSLANANLVSGSISRANIVISMLPPSLHMSIAEWCLTYNKNFITASYESKLMKQLDDEVRKKGLLFLNEVGVDPGLDHISALTLLDKIKAKGGIVKGFKSHTGGIIAQKTPINLWDYKITWNPKNVVRAGAEGALFVKDGETINVPYSEVFLETEQVTVQQQLYDSYPNRDSLKYISKYHIEGVDSCYRGTLRHQYFCEAWNVFVQLGITEDSTLIEFNENSTREDFLIHFLGDKEGLSTEAAFLKLLNLTSQHPIVAKFRQLDFFNQSKPLALKSGTPAEILQHILEESWKIDPQDKDMLLMHHEVAFELEGIQRKATSSLKVIGTDSYFTAMAITVGATLFESFKLVFENNTALTGVRIPTEKSLYTKLIKAVKAHKLIFEEDFV